MLYLIELANFKGFGGHCYPQQILVAKMDESTFTVNPNYMCFSLRCGEYKKIRAKNYKQFFCDMKKKIPENSKIVFEDTLQADAFRELADEEVREKILGTNNCFSLNRYVTLDMGPQMSALDRLHVMIKAIKKNKITIQNKDELMQGSKKLCAQLKRTIQDCAKYRITKSEDSSDSMRDQAKNEAIQTQIKNLCQRHDIYVEFCGTTAYITTVAGEWYIDYAERPISLWHKNAEIRRDKNGNIPNYYHNQKKTFYSPLHAIAYISHHEQAVERRLLTEKDGSETA